MTLEALVKMLSAGSLLLSLAWALSHGFRAASAGLRRLILLSGFAAALASPLLAHILPDLAARHIARPPGISGTLLSVLADRAEVNAPGSPPSQEAPSSLIELPSAGALCTGVWLAVAALLALRLFIGVRRASALLGAAELLQPGVKLSGAVGGPAVVGLFSPTVILPRSARDWDEERLSIVLLHEKSHVRRRDGLALAVAELACAVYWFHPLAWLGVIRLRRECELYADETVVGSGVQATRYAEHLLDLAREMHGHPRALSSALGMAARPSELGRRIQVLLSRQGTLARLTPARTALTSLGAFALLLLVTSIEAAPEERGGGRIARPSQLANGTAFDGRLQYIAEEEAALARRDAEAARVAVVILDAKQGRLLAMEDNEPGAPIPVASTLKPLTIALALDGGHITLDQRFDCGQGRRSYAPDANGPRVLSDVGSHGWLDARQILAVSSNIGASRIFDELGGARLIQGLARFQLDTPPHVDDDSLEGAILAMGARLHATPIALAAAYAVLAHDGTYRSPTPSSRSEAARRVIAPATARTMRSLLEEVVYGPSGTGHLAQVPGMRVAGKTGTAADDQHVALFAGMLPAKAPKFVIVVALSDAKKPGGGGALAAPVFARVAARAMGAD